MTTAARTLPTAQQIGKMLTDLLGKEVETEGTKPDANLLKGPALVVTYAPYGGEVAAACIADISAAASLAAALTMMPASRVDESARAKKLDDALRDNFREVGNVMVSLLNHDSVPAMSLRELIPVPPALPAPLVAQTAKPASRVDVEIGVDGYDGGKLTLMLF